MNSIPMLEIVQLPLARRLWRISKFFQIPINDDRIQNMDLFDIEFYEYSMIADDPKKLERLQNHYYDPEFEEWLEEFDEEQRQKQKQKAAQADEIEQPEQLDLPDEETIVYADESRTESNLAEEEYEEVTEQVEEISDWEVDE